MLSRWLLVALFGCVAITDAELAARMDRDADGEPALQWGGGDCDDEDPLRHPAADEVCDGVDNDCDGTVDDVSSEIFPGATEICDGIDNDCDGLVDDTDPDLGEVNWYADGDVDGWGDAAQAKTTAGCDGPAGFVLDAGDCDDANPALNPDAAEICNSLDDDCDKAVDDQDNDVVADTWYPDADNDQYGDAFSGGLVACDQPFSYLADHTDCDDGDGEVHPDADEICDGVDQDCDEVADDDAIDRTTWYLDGDDDGYGVEDTSLLECDPPKGYAEWSGDCDDDNAAAHPFAKEDCGGSLDLNCDGSTGDEDGDKDGWIACEDCDDGDGAIHPDAAEVCGLGTDADCDGLLGDDDPDTDADSKTRVYPDADSDSYGDETDAGALWCDPPAGTVTDHTDCDDDEADTNPGEAETWYDGIDENCDGWGDYDRDFDGFDAESEGGDDCNDSDPEINPDATEALGDWVDNNCDGVTL